MFISVFFRFSFRFDFLSASSPFPSRFCFHFVSVSARFHFISSCYHFRLISSFVSLSFPFPSRSRLRYSIRFRLSSVSVAFPFRIRFVSVLLMSPLECRFVSIFVSVLFTFPVRFYCRLVSFLFSFV